MASTIAVTRVLYFILCLLGVLLSAYSYYVEFRKESDSSFQALCDISKYMSCSKVFTSKWGRGFGLLELIVDKKHWINQPNSVFGMAFYTMMITLGAQRNQVSSTVAIVFATISNIASAYLGYILYFVLNDICVVCISTYIINFLILLCSLIRRTHMNKILTKVKQQ